MQTFADHATADDIVGHTLKAAAVVENELKAIGEPVKPAAAAEPRRGCSPTA